MTDPTVPILPVSVIPEKRKKHGYMYGYIGYLSSYVNIYYTGMFAAERLPQQLRLCPFQ